MNTGILPIQGVVRNGSVEVNLPEGVGVWITPIDAILDTTICPDPEDTSPKAAEAFVRWIERTPAFDWPESERIDTQSWLEQMNQRGIRELFDQTDGASS